MNSTRNLWPYGIIAAFVVFLSGTTALIVLAFTQHNDLVTTNYYEDEVRFQSQIDRAARAQQATAQATADYDPVTRQLRISLPFDHARNAAGRVQLYRPSEAGLDRQLELHLDPAGVQTIDAAELKEGLWKVRITWTAGGEDFFVDRKIVVKRKHS